MIVHRRPSAALLGAAIAAVVMAVSVAVGRLDAAEPAAPPNLADSAADSFRAAALSHGAAVSDPAHAGIWKAAAPPPGAMHGEFANADPIGLSAGVTIPADCSINWVDPDSRKRYCFSSATSLVVFLEAPHTYLARARENWERAPASAAH